MNKRTFVLILLFLLPALFLNAATWYSEYDAALKAVAAKDWSSAQAKLNESMKLQPQQGRRVFAYGVRFIRYIPAYYLGIVSFHQGRFEDALNQFQQMQSSRLVVAGDPEYGEMTRLQQLAMERLKPKVETTTPPASLPAPVVEEPKPQPVSVDENRSPAPLTESGPAVELKQPPALPEEDQEDKQVQDLEDSGLLAYFSGDYAKAARVFQSVITSKKDFAEAWFYLGCSHASLGLLQGKKGNELLLKARQEFAQARKLDRKLKYFPDLISPRVLEIYEHAK